MNIVPVPITFEERKKAILSEEGNALRDVFGENLINDILKVHEADI
jgi:hypothetical protein